MCISDTNWNECNKVIDFKLYETLYLFIFIKMACMWSWDGSTSLIIQKLNSMQMESNLASKRWNLNPVT